MLSKLQTCAWWKLFVILGNNINRFNFKTLLKSTFTLELWSYRCFCTGVRWLGGGGGCWNSMGKVLSEEVSRLISKEKLFLLFLLKHAFFLSQPYILPTCWKGSSIWESRSSSPKVSAILLNVSVKQGKRSMQVKAGLAALIE